MTEIVTSLFDDHDRAREAVRALEKAGFSSAEISMVASNAGGGGETTSRGTGEDALDGAAAGAALGGLAGAGAGLLTALGVIAIPGLGPLVAAGALATTLTTAAGGALAGGLAGSLVDYGMSEEDANVYAEGVRRGGALVTVRAPRNRAAEARTILRGYNPVDPGARRDQYAGAGWSKYDPASPAYTPEEIERDRERYRA